MIKTEVIQLIYPCFFPFSLPLSLILLCSSCFIYPLNRSRWDITDAVGSHSVSKSWGPWICIQQFFLFIYFICKGPTRVREFPSHAELYQLKGRGDAGKMKFFFLPVLYSYSCVFPLLYFCDLSELLSSFIVIFGHGQLLNCCSLQNKSWNLLLAT